jgi:DNA-binding HxlR family transcriptional regulator
MADDSCSKEACKRQIMAVHDAMDVLNGKWRIFILAVLSYHAHRRFSDLLNDIHGISNYSTPHSLDRNDDLLS